MAALDTNILVRYLVADDKKQFQTAKELIEGGGSDQTYFVPISVIVELEWVLRSLYDQSKAQNLELLSKLLESRELEFQEEASIEIALNLYSENNTDFADCLHVAAAFSHDRAPLITFDRKASRLDDAELLQ